MGDWAAEILASLILGNIAMTYALHYRFGRVMSTLEDHGRRITNLEKKHHEHVPNETDPRGTVPRQATG